MAEIKVPIQVNLPDDWVEQIVNRLRDDPEAEWVEIIRCKDCKHWETSWKPQGASDGRHYCAPLDLYPPADWFCADGKKREES